MLWLDEEKSQRRARTLVFGTWPLNNTAPDNPEIKSDSTRGNSLHSLTNAAKLSEP